MFTHTMKYYLPMQKNETMPFAATWLNPEIVILSEVSQRKTNILWYHLCVEFKTWYKELIYKTETHSQTSKISLLPKGEDGE